MGFMPLLKKTDEMIFALNSQSRGLFEERLATSSAGSVQCEDWIRSVFVLWRWFCVTLAIKSDKCGVLAKQHQNYSWQRMAHQTHQIYVSCWLTTNNWRSFGSAPHRLFWQQKRLEKLPPRTITLLRNSHQALESACR